MIFLIPGAEAFADSSAVVVTMKGEAFIVGGAAKKPLHVHDSVPVGNTVTTGAVSFVRLSFPDNSLVNIGPMTEIKVQPATGNAPTLDVLTGEIRAKVTRDVIQKAAAQDGEDLKMVVKTKSSAIGVRGTDFQVVYNPSLEATALITFEGHVSMAKLEAKASPVAAILSKSAVLVGPGQFSSTTPNAPAASPPVKISPAQFNLLKTNSTMQPSPPAPARTARESISPVPPGADPKALASRGAGLSSVLGATLGAAAAAPAAAAPPPAASDRAPRAGGFIDVHAAIYIPPPAGSAYDANAGVFVPPANAGTVNRATGTYQPPAGLVLNARTGKFEAAPVAAGNGVAGGAVAGATPAAAAMAAALNQAVASPASAAAISLNTSFVASAASAAVLPPAITSSLASATTGSSSAASSVVAATNDSLSSQQTTCLTCHDTNVQSTSSSATKSNVGFTLTIQ